MAIDAQAFRLLLAARKAGADFTRTVTFGRQGFSPRASYAAQALAASALGIPPEALGEFRHRYGEHFFAVMGAQVADSIDASNYEGATIIHDLNQPLPTDLRGRYTLVFDGGTSEHVFNYPQALLSAMQLLEVGGHVVSITAGSSLSGHGFYQISPELFFRLFDQANGFETVAVLLIEARRGGQFYRVTDPAVLRRRVEFVSRRPHLVAVIARKLAAQDALARVPLQSDYQRAWNGTDPSTSGSRFVRESRRVVAQARRLLGRYFYLPWQNAGIVPLTDVELYSLKAPPASLSPPPSKA